MSAQLPPAAENPFAPSLLEPELALTSADALKRYRLGPKSTVKDASNRLLEGEYLVALPAGGYAFDDPFFPHWLERYVLPDLGLANPGRLP